MDNTVEFGGNLKTHTRRREMVVSFTLVLFSLKYIFLLLLNYLFSLFVENGIIIFGHPLVCADVSQPDNQQDEAKNANNQQYD